MSHSVQTESATLPAPLVVGLCLLVALLLYWLGGRISFKGKTTPGELATYSCGEDLPGGKLQIDEGLFFVFSAYFLVFDILAFVIATSLSRPGWLPALYAGIALCAITLLLPLRRLG
jgi:NADH:ubiquinone oxidoreductase subunit 3 (subunit A)